MIVQFLLAGFMIGILGSFHCVGMCGPIALSLPVYDKPANQRVIAVTLYNTGRLLAYIAIGVLLGFLGQQFFIGGYQQFLSIALGVLILLHLVFSSYLNGNILFISTFTNAVKRQLGSLLKSDKNIFTYPAIGFLNGLLPCGLVYVAVAGAMATGNILYSAIFMLGFGLGTFPVMIALIMMGKFISVQSRNHIKKAVPFFVAVMAILLIFRGLNLGIPYVSPKLEQTKTGVHSCCHKD